MECRRLLPHSPPPPLVFPYYSTLPGDQKWSRYWALSLPQTRITLSWKGRKSRGEETTADWTCILLPLSKGFHQCKFLKNECLFVANVYLKLTLGHQQLDKNNHTSSFQEDFYWKPSAIFSKLASNFGCLHILLPNLRGPGPDLVVHKSCFVLCESCM